jgi:hypothetical protein
VYTPEDGKGDNKIVNATVEVKKASSTMAIANDWGTVERVVQTEDKAIAEAEVPQTGSTLIDLNIPATKEGNWWQVDLGKVYNIDKMVVWNYSGAAWDRLQNFYRKT